MEALIILFSIGGMAFFAFLAVKAEESNFHLKTDNAELKAECEYKANLIKAQRDALLRFQLQPALPAPPPRRARRTVLVSVKPAKTQTDVQLKAMLSPLYNH